MSIAYLIAAHGNYAHLQRLIDALEAEEAWFYIHIDHKSAIPALKGNHIFFIEERVDVRWSGFSQVTVTLKLLERAIKDRHHYYAFISGTDYPIKANSWLFGLLASGGEYMHIHRIGEDPFAPLSRYKYYYFTDHYDRRNKNSYRTRFFLWLQKRLRSLRIRKRIPFPLYTGASWFVLSGDAVEYILHTVNSDSRYTRFFRSGFCPDEAFFQTIIGNSRFAQHIRGYLTYADWSVSPGPAIIDETHLPLLAAINGKFFARKFTDTSSAVTLRIDRELRNQQINDGPGE